MQRHLQQLEELVHELQRAICLKFKRKNRRVSNEIDKNYICPYEKCGKNYGSDVSLNLHIKIKHNGGNKTEREKLAVFPLVI